MMEVLLQLPLADLRSLVTRETGRRSRPTWPTGRVGRSPGEGEFLPGFGPLRRTPASGTGGWEGRAQNVPASRAVRLPAGYGTFLNDWMLSRVGRTQDDRRYRLKLRDRNFYGSAVSPRSFLEMRFNVDAVPEGALPWTHLRLIALGMLNIPVRVATGQVPIPFAEAGPQFARLVARASTRNTYHEQLPAWLLSPGPPMCVIEVDDFPTVGLDDGIVSPDGGNGQPMPDLRYSEIEASDVWFVRRSQALESKTLHLHLLRLHSERVAFEAVARALAYNSRADVNYQLQASDPRVQRTIQACINYLSRSVAYGRNQTGLLRAIEFDLTLHAAEWDALRSSLLLLPERTQVQVTQVLELVIGEKVMGDKFENIHNSTIVNRSAVVDSFNQIASNNEQELLEALKEISAAVEKEGNHQAADLTEGLIKEFAGARNPSVLQLFWNGLKAAAPVVSSLAGAVGVISGFL